MTSHVLIARDPAADGNPLIGYQRYDQVHQASPFRKVGPPGHLGAMAVAAFDKAVASGRDVSVAALPGPPDALDSQAVGLIDNALMASRPVTLVVREHLSNTRWVSAWIATGIFAEPIVTPMAGGAVQGYLDSLAKSIPPYNQRDAGYQPQNILLRHGVTAEELGLIAPESPNQDHLLSMVASDREVLEAPVGDEYALARARDHAQQRLGIAEDQRAYQYSGEIESELLPVIFRMDRDDPPIIAAALQRQFRYRFKELGHKVLAAALRGYTHGGRIDEVRAAIVQPLTAT